MKTQNRGNYVYPNSVEELKEIVGMAFTNGTKIRVKGSGHSFPGEIIAPDDDQSIFLVLSSPEFIKVEIDSVTGHVKVGAGCHIGRDPEDPTSTDKNNLIVQLKERYAIPDLGGITHQTVGGFLSTGSSGGSTKYSFHDCIQSIEFIPANSRTPEIKVCYKDDPETKDLFYAAGVSLGLLGIITSVTFNFNRPDCKYYAIKGDETIYEQDNPDISIDFFGHGPAGKPSLQDFLGNKDIGPDYTRIFWWPQPKSKRFTIWQANRIDPTRMGVPKPYLEIHGSKPGRGFSRLLEGIGGEIFTLIGQYPFKPKELIKLINKALITHGEAPFVTNDAKGLSFYNDIFPLIMLAFVPTKLDPDWNPQTFHDYYYRSLPMDNNIDDNVFPERFTELWIDIEKTNEVMNCLKTTMDNFYTKPASETIPCGDSCIEIYAAKASDFWLSPSYGKKNKIRIDPMWFGKNKGNPETYFKLYWDALKKYDYTCHWGKYLPKDYINVKLNDLYPMWSEFDKIRKVFDPNDLFVNNYWKQILGI